MESFDCERNEGPSIQVEDFGILINLMLNVSVMKNQAPADSTYSVPPDGICEASKAVGIEIIRPNIDPFLGSWGRKWTNASHDIANGFTGLKFTHKSIVFCVESAVPIDFGVVEAERASTLPYLHCHVLVAGQMLILECPILGCIAHVVNFVDHSPYAWILIH